ncbi:MAG: CDP-alcohol phosphatidyltransferase family protein [Pseudotabrizicola sp.]|uniref:CDP-alcohol phosphatidyltransferase family protein n=1 Tax=Pseudotabrizicola sp. TaxID=2939647 RepID=UPI002728D51B|nr:CDP-alcohol phosphatidyltransferase family protein [Pseudotabrizicola sp.]MDO8884239.1 CDP-alcohol phosphatidyltransferase family protein [Pseudotabrizicola sp.]MDP2083009.1 CDP-alcohol phosphatidyltransferase family protein [Pseudotabrizicola sp.]MDZ7572427.1 CDP-alcohol phosphatidyltransferase family protein [Pseudotabrizicola sp.]
MLDGVMRRWIDPPLNRGGHWLAARGATADGVTLVGLGFGLLGAVLLAVGMPGWLALVPLLIGRVMDGLDGAVARATFKTDFGGYFDIFCDFVFYAAIPLAFVLRDPGQNAVAGAFLLAAFYINAASFLGYAIIAAKRRMSTTQQGEKSLYYAVGLLEGTETIAFFTLLCLVPSVFPAAALVFGGLCLVTASARVVLGRRAFYDAPSGRD